MTTEDRGPWAQTYTGRMFHHRDPRAADIDVHDIAHALACQARFGGHAREPYSVAQHSVMVAVVARRLASQAHDRGALDIDDRGATYALDRIAFAGLLHDAAEAYVVDVPRPLKHDLGPAYRDAEERVQRAVLDRFHAVVGPSWLRYVKRADEIALATEAEDLMRWPPPRDWDLAEPAWLDCARPLRALDWRRAREQFLATFNYLCRPGDRLARRCAQCGGPFDPPVGLFGTNDVRCPHCLAAGRQDCYAAEFGS